MFFNVRLMIAAVAASIIVLVCGFSLFAAFRVNHVPLSRLAAGTPPLTLAADNAVPAAPSAPGGTPLDARFQLMPAQVAGAAAPDASAPVAAARTPPAGSRPEDNVAAQAVASDAAATSSADTPPAQEKGTPPAQTAATEPAATTEPAAKPDDVAAVPNPAPAAPTAPETVAAEPPAVPPESAPPLQQAHDEAKPETTAAMPTTMAASEPPPPAEQSPSDTQSSGQANQETKPETTDKPAAEPAPKKPHHKARRTKLAAKPRAPRGARPAVASTGIQPAYNQPFATQPTYARAFGTDNSGVGGPFVPVVAAKRRPAHRNAAVAAKSQSP